MADGETALISERAADSNILVNGVGCNVAATHTLLKKIQVTLRYSPNGGEMREIVGISYLNDDAHSNYVP